MYKEERIFLQISVMDGKVNYCVGGGLKNDGQMEYFESVDKCLEEIKQRSQYAIKNM